MRWQTLLKFLVLVLLVVSYICGYGYLRISQYVWSKPPEAQSWPQSPTSTSQNPAPAKDGVAKALYKPMDYVAKMTKDSSLDLEDWLNWFDKKIRPDGPPVSEEEMGQRFKAAHQEGSIQKIRGLFYKGDLHEDDARQIARFFDFNLVSLGFSDLARESLIHSRFDDDLVPTRMMVVTYGTSRTLLPKELRFFAVKKDGRYFLTLRYGKG